MKSSAVHISLFAILLSLTALSAAAQTPPSNPAGAIPSALGSAKTVFLGNGGADGGLFPMPFSGDPNRAYFSLFSQLKALGKYDLVSTPAQADLVMEIQLFSPAGPRNSDKSMGAADPLPFFKLTIYDARTHFAMWAITEPIEWAILQKTHDRNFDTALSNVAADVDALSQPQPSALYPHPPAHLGAWQR
jgi:hypothetical protein